MAEAAAKPAVLPATAAPANSSLPITPAASDAPVSTTTPIDNETADTATQSSATSTASAQVTAAPATVEASAAISEDSSSTAPPAINSSLANKEAAPTTATNEEAVPITTATTSSTPAKTDTNNAKKASAPTTKSTSTDATKATPKATTNTTPATAAPSSTNTNTTNTSSILAGPITAVVSANPTSKATAEIPEDAEFRITFKSKSLGMRLKLIHGKILVTNFLRGARTGKMLAAEAGGIIKIGDRVVAVAGKRLHNSTFKDAINMIMKGGRPLQLSFRRGPGDSKGTITYDKSPAGNFFGNIFSQKNKSNIKKPKNQIGRIDSMRLHKNHLSENQREQPPADAAASSRHTSTSSPTKSPTTRDGRPLKSCLKSPLKTPSPKKSVRFSDEAGSPLEQVWFADNTHYSTSKQRRLGIYTPRMDDPCVVS